MQRAEEKGRIQIEMTGTDEDHIFVCLFVLRLSCWENMLGHFTVGSTYTAGDI